MKKQTGTTWADIVRRYFPTATDDEVHYILWEKTGYPTFWNIGKDGATAAECCATQVKRFKDAVRKRKAREQLRVEAEGK